MSKRYGRNQKRAARERIAALEAALAAANGRADLAERIAMRASQALERAEEAAFARLSEASGLLRLYTDRIGAEVGRALGDRLRPVAEGILSQQRERPALAMRSDALTGVNVLRGTIPSMAYAVAISRLEMRDFYG